MSDLSKGGQPENKARLVTPVPDVASEAEPGSPGRQPLPQDLISNVPQS